MDSDWKPKAWIAIGLGFFLQPFTFLYLNKPKLFWIYLLLVILIGFFDTIFGTLFSLSFFAICPLHAYLVVKKFTSVRHRGWYSKPWGISIVLSAVLVPIFITRSFLYEPFYIPSGSMIPSLNVGDRILVKKLGYGTYGSYGITLLNTDLSTPRALQRGKVYVFNPPFQNVKYVMRLMGLPGDRIKIIGNSVYINGKKLKVEIINEKRDSLIIKEQNNGQSYLTLITKRQRPQQETLDYVVPEKSYFFMGDNRNYSNDSRFWGFVTSKNLIGEVIYVFSPSSKQQ